MVVNSPISFKKKDSLIALTSKFATSTLVKSSPAFVLYNYYYYMTRIIMSHCLNSSCSFCAWFFCRYRKSGLGRAARLPGRKLDEQFGTPENHRRCQIRSQKRRGAGTQISILAIFANSTVDQIRGQHELLCRVNI